MGFHLLPFEPDGSSGKCREKGVSVVAWSACVSRPPCNVSMSGPWDSMAKARGQCEYAHLTSNVAQIEASYNEMSSSNVSFV